MSEARYMFSIIDRKKVIILVDDISKVKISRGENIFSLLFEVTSMLS